MQHTIRTMSKGGLAFKRLRRAADFQPKKTRPPTFVSSRSISALPTSSGVRQPLKIRRLSATKFTTCPVGWSWINVKSPMAYENCFSANKEIERDEFESLPKWTKLAIDDGAATTYALRDALAPNTEYVFKIRALYANGPGVFSVPCITRTLPEGAASIEARSTSDKASGGSF